MKDPQANRSSKTDPDSDSANSSARSIPEPSVQEGDETEFNTFQNAEFVPSPTAIVDGCTSGSTSNDTNSQQNGFRIVRTYAQGGLGRVLLAHDSGLGRDVAIKDISPNQSNKEESRARLLREARVTGSLEHPNIVPVYNFGYYEDGSPYYVMRFVQGITLREAIRDFHDNVNGQDNAVRRLGLQRLLTHFINVCRAVGYAHNKGVLHRDIKPANVMIGANDETFVLDWGLTKAFSDAETTSQSDGVSDLNVKSNAAIDDTWDFERTRLGSVLGTPGFMSPEQAAGDVESLGPETDIYGLGSTLYYLLTGQRAFKERLRSRLLTMTIAGHFQRPRSIVRSTPGPLEAICLKAMSTAATDRYRSAAEIAEEIESWLAGAPVAAYVENVWERTERWITNHRSIAALGFAALLAVGLVSVVSGFMVLRFQDEKQAEQQRREVAEDVQRYTDTVHRIENRLDHPMPGFVAENEVDLRDASLINVNLRDAKALRTLAANTLTAVDISRKWTAFHGLTFARACQFSPDGKTFAVGCSQINIGKDLIHLHQMSDGNIVRTLQIDEALIDMVTYGVKQGVGSIDFSDDGRLLVAGLNSGEVAIWDMTRDRKKPVSRWRVGDAHDVHVVFGTSAEFLYTASKNGVTKWGLSDLSEPLLHWTLPDREAGEGDWEIVGLTFDSSSGSLVLSCGWQIKDIWRIDADRLVPETSPLSLGYATRPSISHDGRFMAVCHSEGAELKLYDGQTLSPLSGRSFINPSINAAHIKSGADIDLNPQGSLLASVVGNNIVGTNQSRLTIWDVATGLPIQRDLLTDGHGVKFSPDGSSIAVLNDQETIMYSLRESSELTTIAHHATGVTGVGFLSPTNGSTESSDSEPNTEKVVCLGTDRVDGQSELSLWSLIDTQAEWLPSSDIARRSTGLAVHHSGQWVVSTDASVNRIESWELPGVTRAKKLNLPWSLRMTFASDGSRLWTAGITNKEHFGRVNVVRCFEYPALRPSGGWMNLLHAVGHDSGAEMISIDASERLCVVGSNDAILRVFSVGTDGEVTLQAEQRLDFPATSVAVFEDDSMAAVGLRNGDILIVGFSRTSDPDEMNVNVLSRIAGDYGEPVTTLAIAKEDRLVASGSLDHTVRLWRLDADQLEELVTLNQFRHSIKTVRFSDDASKLAILTKQARAIRILHVDRLRSKLGKMSLNWLD